MFFAFNPEKTSQKITNFLRLEFKKAGFTKAVIGLSGGIDSTVSSFLTVSALGSKNVVLVLLPFGKLSLTGLQDGQEVARLLKIPKQNILKIDIAPFCQKFFQLDDKMDLLRKGNIMARVRMIILFDLAKKQKALVVGTENKSEHLLSYFTRFGDEASDIEPIRGLYKTEIRLLAKYLGVPDRIINKAPTAELWENQTDEGQFGFSYEEADKILFLLFDQKNSVADVIKKGFPKELVEKVYSWVKINDFKHHLPKIPVIE